MVYEARVDFVSKVTQPTSVVYEEVDATSLHRLFYFTYNHLRYYDPLQNPADLLPPSHYLLPTTSTDYGTRES
jgi:hypothetical protein